MGDAPETRLKTFISDNKDTLSALALMAVLFSTMANIEIIWIRSILSFLLVGGIVLVWFELGRSLPDKMSTELRLFKIVLLLGLAMIIFYWLIIYSPFWRLCLPFIVVIVTVYLVATLIKGLFKIELLRTKLGLARIPSKGKTFVRYLVAYVVVLAGIWISGQVATPLDSWLDMMYKASIN
jgi:predicted membrane metal-binding protein